MARMNIFEVLKTYWCLEEELDRLITLFEEYTSITYRDNKYSIKDFVYFFCFNKWINRGRFLDSNDYLNSLGFLELVKQAKDDEEAFITVVEVMYNFYYLSKYTPLRFNAPTYSADFSFFQKSMDNYLEHYNYYAHVFGDKQQVIIVEKDPAATAVAEISDSETAYQVIQYNHHTLKGDIASKKRILLYLASELEAKKNILKSNNKTLHDDISLLLNNMDIRHNNRDPESRDYKQYVAEMTEVTLEEWYDDLYQMILLAKLELDNLDRKEKVRELKIHL